MDKSEYWRVNRKEEMEEEKMKVENLKIEGIWMEIEEIKNEIVEKGII